MGETAKLTEELSRRVNERYAHGDPLRGYYSGKPKYRVLGMSPFSYETVPLFKRPSIHGLFPLIEICYQEYPNDIIVPHAVLDVQKQLYLVRIAEVEDLQMLASSVGMAPKIFLE